MYEVIISKDNKLVHSFLTNALIKDGAHLMAYEYIVMSLHDVDNISDYKIEVNELRPENFRIGEKK